MRAGLWLALLAAAATGCGRPVTQTLEHRVFAMGTWVDITIVAEPSTATAAVLGDIEQLLGRFGRDYYAWGDGELAALNRALAAGETFTASPELAALLAAAQRLAAATDGAFDPGIGPLVELWGFHDAALPQRALPTDAAVMELRDTLARMRDVTIDGRRIGSPSRVVKLDLGGIAKGEAVDRVIALLRAAGLGDAMVNAGGDLRVSGRAPARAWRIGIRAPRASTLIGAIELADGEAAFTSGDYERFVERPEGRAHHLLDPATGHPVLHTQAVTVVAADGVTADAAATALFVAGPGRWRAHARALGVTDVLRVDATGRIEVTASMRERLQLSTSESSDIIVVDP